MIPRTSPPSILYSLALFIGQSRESPYTSIHNTKMGPWIELVGYKYGSQRRWAKPLGANCIRWSVGNHFSSKWRFYPRRWITYCKRNMSGFFNNRWRYNSYQPSRRWKIKLLRRIMSITLLCFCRGCWVLTHHKIILATLWQVHHFRTSYIRKGLWSGVKIY